MNFLVKPVTKNISFYIPYIKIYADDINLAVLKNKIRVMLIKLKQFDTKLQFRVEKDDNGIFPFLDVIETFLQIGTRNHQTPEEA